MTTPTSNYPPTPAGVRAALTALGTTPRRVAVRLHAGRHFGEPGEGRLCPVARYLSAVLDGHTTVTVGDEDVYVQPPDASQFRLSLPSPVRRFVVAFDDGGFQFLLPDHTDDTDRMEV
jgi:hypothetical protein